MAADLSDAFLRYRLLRAMAETVNCWSNGFDIAAYGVAAALLDGRIPQQVLEQHRYPAHDPANGYRYDDALEQRICYMADLPFITDPDQRSDSGWLLNVDSEQIGTAVDLLKEITRGEATIHGGGFGFYQELLDEHDLTLDQVREYMASLDLKGAAQLIVDAFTTLKKGR